jgi:hypothetical protein
LGSGRNFSVNSGKKTVNVKYEKPSLGGMTDETDQLPQVEITMIAAFTFIIFS